MTRSSMEFAPESMATADKLHQKCIVIMGGTPQEDEYCTVEQLTAQPINKRVNSLDLPPYVDLAVWQPYGRRPAREVPIVDLPERDCRAERGS
eukprot:s1684_g3.t1